MVRPTFAGCLLSGGVAAVFPGILISALAMFTDDVFTLQVLRDLCGMFALGAIAGALFWAIAFLGLPNKPVS
jgi:hypothetical protein